MISRMHGRVPKFDQTDEDSAIETFVKRKEGKKNIYKALRELDETKAQKKQMA